MNKKSLIKCLEQIVADIELRKTVNYGDRSSVRRYNAAYDRIEKNVKYIENNYPDQLHVFTDLLFCPNQSVSYTCACMILNVLKCSSKMKRTALDEVKRQLAAGQLDALTEVYLPYIIQEWEEIIADLEESEKRQTNY